MDISKLPKSLSSDENSQLKRKKIVRPWTKEEDEYLLKAIELYGKEDWENIAMKVPTRSRKQCKERFLNHLDDDVHKQPWTKDEDELILLKREELGNKWTEISKYIPGRAPNSIKNRYFSHLTRVLKKKPNSFHGHLKPPPKNDVNDVIHPYIIKSSPSVFKPVQNIDHYEII